MDPWRQLAARTSVVCVTRLKLFLRPCLEYKTVSIFGCRLQSATHKPTHRRTRALLPRRTRLTQTPHAPPRGAIANLWHPLTAHTSIVCVTRLKSFLCPFLGHKSASIFGGRMQPATHKPTPRRMHTEPQHHRRNYKDKPTHTHMAKKRPQTYTSRHTTTYLHVQANMHTQPH